MSPIPGEPHESKPQELVTEDGRKVKLRIPGMAAPPRPEATEQREADEPPPEDPRPPLNPHITGY